MDIFFLWMGRSPLPREQGEVCSQARFQTGKSQSLLSFPVLPCRWQGWVVGILDWQQLGPSFPLVFFRILLNFSKITKVAYVYYIQ